MKTKKQDEQNLEEELICPEAQRCPDVSIHCLMGDTDHKECSYYEDKTHHQYQSRTKVMERF